MSDEARNKLAKAAAWSPAEPPAESSLDDGFDLFDLKVEWVGEGPCWCKAKAGDHFELHGEQLHFPPGQSWSIYTLAPLLPLLPAKQRPSHANDWMSTDARVACPDPNCNAHFRISRCGLRRFSHAQTTAVPLAEPQAPLEPERAP